MTPVEFHFVLPTGVPLVDSPVEIQLVRSAFTADQDGVAMPRPITVRTDSEGKATLPLWPSETLYYVSVQDPLSEAGLSYKFVVPKVAAGLTVRLQDIVVDSAPPGTTFDDAAMLVILEAKASSAGSMIAAAASAAAAAADAAAVIAAKNTAVTKASEAASSAVSAAASAAAAQVGSRGTYRGLKDSELDMFAITLPVIGDKVKRTDPGYEGQVFELIALPATNLDNWLAYSGGGGTDATASDYADDYADNYA